MAKLRGVVVGDRSHTEASRLGSKTVQAFLNTWGGQLALTLHDDGSYSLRVDGEWVYGGKIKVKQDA